ncbi:MAG: hypothetical protein ILP17_09115 [Lachnospiraceae bacterium]|nr:hypothetical protein [Lachnospiraceae bacterium]
MNDEKKQQVLKALESLKLRMLLDQKSIRGQSPDDMKTVQGIRNGLESDVRKLEIFSDISSNVTDVQSMMASDDEAYTSYPVKGEEIYFSIGRVNRNQVAKYIVQYVGDSSGISYDAGDSSIALFSFKTDKEGRYINGSFSLSGLLWVASEIRKKSVSTAYGLRVSDYENAVNDYEEIVSGQNVRDFLYAISTDAYDKYVRDIFDGVQDGFLEYNRYPDERALKEDAPEDYSALTDDSVLKDINALSELIGADLFGDDTLYEKQVTEYIMSGYDRYVFAGAGLGDVNFGGRLSLADAVFSGIIGKAYIIAMSGDEPDDIFEMHSFRDGPLRSRGNAYSEFAPHYYSIYDERLTGSSLLIACGDEAAAEDISRRLSGGEFFTVDSVQGVHSDDPAYGSEPSDAGESANTENDVYVSDTFFAGYADALFGSSGYKGLFCAPLVNAKDIGRYCREVLQRYCDDYGNVRIKEEHKQLYVTYRREFLRQYDKLGSMGQGSAQGRIEAEKEKLLESACRMLREFAASSRYLKLNIINLMRAWGMYDKCNVKMTEEDKAAAMPCLIQSLFLLTPVIATTYSGIRNMVGDTAVPGMLGTLLAGVTDKASAHYALGVMLRCRGILFTS